MVVRIAVLASGGGTNLQALIDFLGREGDLASGRIVVVASIAAESFSADDDGSTLIELLERHAVDLVVLAGYMRRIPPAVIRAYHRRIVNVHPALLPDFGGKGMYGARVHEAVIAAGVPTTGVTVHFVDDELDHGPLIAQWRIAVREGETPLSLA